MEIPVSHCSYTEIEKYFWFTENDATGYLDLYSTAMKACK